MDDRLNIVLLSGGSGKRLWPLSNDIRSKQFIKIFKNDDGSYESMVQRIYRQIKNTDKNANVFVSTSRSQVSSINNQLGDNVGIIVEPVRKDTFPAIALATAYLHGIKGVKTDESVVICPVDPYVGDDYFKTIQKIWELSKNSDANLTVMGITPTYPSEKYGYIIPENGDEASRVLTFKEKPDKKTAEKYIQSGGLWNGGVFAYKIGYILDKAQQLLGFSDYNDLLNNYHNFEKISFDYAIAENEKNIAVVRFSGEWKDLGTWNTLTEVMQENAIGDVVLDEKCNNVHIINELDIPLIAMGLNSVVIAASPEGILISDKEQSSYLKPFVDNINNQVMFAEKSWGSYRVINIEEGSTTVKVTLNPGHKMNYHSHNYRDEVWTVISGTGYTVIDGNKQFIKTGDVISLPIGCKHTVVAETELQLIEVQIGENIRVDDKQKYQL